VYTFRIPPKVIFGLLGLVGALILVIPAFYLYLGWILRPQHFEGYERCVERDFEDEIELKALEAAENLDYGTILNQERWDSGEPDIFANFIDNRTITEADEYAANHNTTSHLVLNYTARVQRIESCSIHFLPIEKDIVDVQFVGIDQTVFFSFMDDPWLLKYYWRFFVFNGSQKEHSAVVYPFEWNLTSGGYLVDMHLLFSKSFGSLGASVSRLHQIVIVDDQFNVRLLMVEEPDYLVA